MMKSVRLIPAFLLLLIFASLLPAQTPSPTPVPPAIPANKSSTSEDSRDEDIVRINTTLVSVPFSVMDKNGRYVSHLRQEDFRIYAAADLKLLMGRSNPQSRKASKM